MINVLVLGVGSMGQTHIKAYKTMEAVQVVGVVDLYPEKVDTKQIPVFDSLEAAVNNISHIDVVDICLPTHLHKQYVEKVARLGIHIICEKPLARTLDEVKQMINICEANHVQLFVGHVGRFFPAYEHAKQLIESGAIGQAGVVRMTRNSGFPAAFDKWYKDEQKSGGVILDLLIHDFDFLRWCFGDVKRVYAKGFSGHQDTQLAYALVTLRFESGAIAHLEGSWTDQKFSTSYEFAGDAGMITYDSRGEQTIELSLHGQSSSTFSSPTIQSPYEKELAHFIECIRHGETPIISPQDAYEAMKIALAAIESLGANEPVLLKTFQTGGVQS